MNSPDSPNPRRVFTAPPACVFALIFGVTFLLHAPLLRLPYFWDEAGYYIPSARDLLLTGNVIPHSAPSNAHPPLVMAYLATWWKLAGYAPPVTRASMLLLAGFALLAVFRLARRVANIEVAVGATLCTALYPVFFAQSTMAHVDLAAAGLTLWGLDSYLGGRLRTAALWFSLAVLAKETAILAVVGLLAWEVAGPWISRIFKQPLCFREFHWMASASLLVPVAVLTLWYAYHYSRTGYVFGNPEFFRYNVQSTMSLVRFLLALGMRTWQAFGYMHLWVLTALTGWAMTRPPISEGEVARPRISVPVQWVFGVVILSYVVALAVVGGAVLARYLLTAIPLIVILAVSTLWRRVRAWRTLVVIVCACFVAALFLNPPYRFSPEDNLAYRDYILMHEDAERFLQARYPMARVLTAWPASDEISRPYLGYVTRPLRVLRVENFSAEEVRAAAEERSRFDVALVFSTKYEPVSPLLNHWPAWERLQAQYFGFHRDLPPAIAAQLLGGRVVFTEARQGQWVAVIELERVEDARWRSPRPSLRHEMAGVGFHNQPHFAAGSQLQRVSRSQRQMDFHFHAHIDPSGDHDVPAGERRDSPGEHVSGAQSLWADCRQQDVTRSNADAHGGAGLASNQRRLQLHGPMHQPAGHGATFFARGFHFGVEQVFESSQLRNRFLSRRRHDLVGIALRHNAPSVKQQDSFPESEYFVPAVSHVQDRDSVRFVPGPQIIDDAGLGRGIQRSQGLVEQKNARIGDQRARQGYALPLAAGNLTRTSLAHIVNAQGFEDALHPWLAHRRRDAFHPIGNVPFNR
jgi:4-amino-4-deoxy-L-arabinose transferase-like glycosyltransferase